MNREMLQNKQNFDCAKVGVKGLKPELKIRLLRPSDGQTHDSYKIWESGLNKNVGNINIGIN